MPRAGWAMPDVCCCARPGPSLSSGSWSRARTQRWSQALPSKSAMRYRTRHAQPDDARPARKYKLMSPLPAVNLARFLSRGAPMRTPLVAGNWKMNGSRESAADLLEALVRGLEDGTDAEVLV